MKRQLFSILAIAAITATHSVKAEKTVSTTTKVPVTAKSVTISGGTTTVDCDPQGPRCFEQTVTTTTEAMIMPGYLMYRIETAAGRCQS